MPGFLERIVDVKRREVATLKKSSPGLSPDAPETRGFLAALRGDGLQAIAEFKRKSPSKGPLGIDAEPATVAATYQQAGAAAMSVLTDSEFFGGSLDDLRSARQACSLPILRKDFMIDPVQIVESRNAGADAILLIVRILSNSQLAELHAAAVELRLDVLIEVHNEAEMERAVACSPAAIGINCRDLDTFETDLAQALALGAALPADRIRVAESGIRGSRDAQAARAAGFDAILVGEALMRSEQPAALLKDLLLEPAS